MEVDQELSTSPFWRQSNSDHRGGRRLRRTSSIALNSGAVMIAVIVAALAFIFVVVPSIASFGSQVFRPQSVKKGWDSLNLVLVLFAVVCGFIGRSSGGGEARETPKWSDTAAAAAASRQSWNVDSSDRNNAVFGRMRSSNSYPDLRQEPLWTVDERWRFHDDTDVGDHHHLRFHGRSWQDREEPKAVEEDLHHLEELKTENIEVDPIEVSAREEDPSPEANEAKPEEQSPPRRPRSPSPPPPPKRKPKRSYRAVGTENTENRYFSEASQPLPPSRPPPPAPPPPPPPPRRSSEYRETETEIIGVKIEKKRGKEFLISLRRKKKKQRQKSVENFDAIFASSDPNPPQHFNSPPNPPPPPPPPPSSSVFMNLFSPKRGKTRRSQSPPKIRVSRNTTKIQPAPITRKPAMPTESSPVEVIGNESPMNPIPPPPPPPPPPFRVREWRFPRNGDFVRVTSGNSSRSASPDPYAGDSSPAEGESPMEASTAAKGISPEMAFCPSPDVDTKADNFIARFRAGLVLEKENSFRERDGIGGTSKSRLGRER